MAESDFIEQLQELAFLSELKSQNPFKIKAIQNGARILKKEPDSVTELLQSGKAKNMKGIGKGLLAMMQEYAETGEISERDELASDLPETIFELVEIPGLGPKKAKALYNDLGVASLSELEYACNENRLISLKGFGDKTQKKIIEEISYLKLQRGKVLLPSALYFASELAAKLKGEVVGEVARYCEVVESIDILLEGAKLNKKLLKDFDVTESEQPETETAVSEILFAGESEDGLPVRVHAPFKGTTYACAKFVLASSAGFCTGLNVDKKLDKLRKLSTEADIAKALGVPELPPELREAEHLDHADKLDPAALITEADIRGVFHNHTHYSDGANSLEEMVAAAAERKYQYIGISDHSQTAFYAGGLKEAAVKKQKKEIATLQKRFPNTKIFFGIESDILPSGKLDYPAATLKEFDFVIASVHAQLNQSKEAMTKRICTALENKHTTWLGHCTGRLLLGRRGYPLDMQKVFATAKANKKSIELNANPYRLDLDWREHQAARKNKISIGVFPDAHSTGGLDDTKYGVMLARKGGLTKADVTNTKSAEEMQKWLQQQKQ